MFSFIFKKISSIKEQIGETFAFFSQILETKMAIDDAASVTNEVVEQTNEFVEEIQPNLNRINRRINMMKKEIEALKKK